MKLYATVLSERASKSQGGQEFIRVEINGEKVGDYIFTTRIVPDKYGKARIDQVGGDLNFLRGLIEKAMEAAQEELVYKTKGNKQKGKMLAPTDKCPTCGEPYGDCEH